MKGQWRTWVLAFSLGLNAVLISALLIADVRFKNSLVRKPPKEMGVSAAGLHLTPDQQQQWDAFDRERDREILRVHAATVKRMEHLAELLSQGRISRQDVDKVLQEMRQGTLHSSAGMLEHYLKQQSILDEQQNALLSQRYQERVTRMQKWANERYENIRQRFEDLYGEGFILEALQDVESDESPQEGVQH